MNKIYTGKFIVSIVVVLAVSSCGDEEKKIATEEKPAEYSYAESAPEATQQTDAIFSAHLASTVGIDFVHTTGATGEKLMPETMGPGCGLVDYDSDGTLELAFVDGKPWTTDAGPPLVRLYKWDEGKYSDITTEAGLDSVHGYGMGLAAADYDGDADVDFLITLVDGVKLLRNDAGKFIDVTEESGLAYDTPEWATTAAFIDVDNNGWLDLFVAQYVKWSLEDDVFTTLNGSDKSYATPKVYEGIGNRLYYNNGDGTFRDISESAGVSNAENKALGVVVMDSNNDGYSDIFVSNDTVANKLYINNGKGQFEDIGLIAGIGYDEMGNARAGMGVDSSHDVRSGRASIAVGNFSNESISHFDVVEGSDLYIDTAQKRGLALTTQPMLTFGLRFGDFDNDGDHDILLANGHIEPEINEVQSAITYKQPIELFLTGDSERYTDYKTGTGVDLGPAIVARCLAAGDIEGDGDLDAIITTNGGEPIILENTAGGDRSLQIDLADSTVGNRQALGATVTVTAGEWSTRDRVRSRGSYLSHSPYTLHFGVPESAGNTVVVTVIWPDGTEQTIDDVEVGSRARIQREGKSLTSTQLSQ